MNENGWHHMPIKEVLQTLQTEKRGLTEEEANRRLGEFGYNEPNEAESYKEPLG